MTPQEAVNRLRPALAPQGGGTFCFASSKVFLRLKLLDNPARLRYTAKDQVIFRVEECNLIIADAKTGVIRNQLGWREIESMVAGEPESDNAVPFQG